MSELVSVVIPTFNRADVICDTVRNVLAQTYPHLEVIVVDDGSTDDTSSRLKVLGDRIRVVRQANAGPAAARNRGIAASRGEIVAFQDSDDRWMPAKIERQVRALRAAGRSVPCCITNALLKFANQPETTSFQHALLDADACYEEGLWVNVTEVFVTRFVLFNQTVAVRREVLERIGAFDESMKFYEDIDLPLRLSLEGPWAFIREPLVTWLQGSAGSWSEQANSKPLISLPYYVRILENLCRELEQKNASPTLKRGVRRQLNYVRRSLVAAEMEQKTFPGVRAAARMLAAIEHYRSALFRRSPWYPRMMARPLHSLAAAPLPVTAKHRAAAAGVQAGATPR